MSTVGGPSKDSVMARLLLFQVLILAALAMPFSTLWSTNIAMDSGPVYIEIIYIHLPIFTHFKTVIVLFRLLVLLIISSLREIKDNHLLLIDLRSKGINGSKAEAVCEQASIVLNKPLDILFGGTKVSKTWYTYTCVYLQNITHMVEVSRK